MTANSVEGYVILDDMDMDWEAHELDSHWINTENVLVGLSEADARMYEDKRAYYAKNRQLDRRRH